MSNRILHLVLVLLFPLSLSTAEAQLFKGKAQRQSGGNNFGGNSMQQPQQRGGLFQKGRERRESNQSNNGQSFNNNGFNNNSIQQQPKTGLFKKNKQPQQYSNGAPVKQGGLFAKAKERKLQEYNQANYQNQNRSYTNSNSQSSNSYVRSNQKVTGASGLFNQPANQTVGTNSAPASATQSGFGSTLPAQQQQSVSAIASRLETQPERSQLPSLVSASVTAERQADRPRPPAVTPTNLKTPPTKRPKPQPVTVNASRLREQAPPAPNAKPTSNKPDLSKPKVEVTAAVLA